MADVSMASSIVNAAPHDINSTTTTTISPVHRHSSTSSSGSLPEQPPPPVPSSDPRLAIDPGHGAASATAEPQHDLDLFKLVPAEALKLLSGSIELLVKMTGDIPPTPPPKMATDPQMSGIHAEKEIIVRTHSQKSLLQLRQQAILEDVERKRSAGQQQSTVVTGKRPPPVDGALGGKSKLQAYSAAMTAQLSQQQTSLAAHSTDSPAVEAIDGVQLRPEVTARRSPPPSPYIIVGDDSQPINLQHSAITRKFYSKNEPPITINQYLQRLHQFCPMSAAVYLATSLYIHRLAVEERAIPVTKRNAHRLVLAGLRVAMKALEDLSYPHTKFAKVGGVSETELARLEISFCFLTGFELVVGEETLRRHWETLRGGKTQRIMQGLEVPILRLDRKPRGMA